MYRYVVRRLAFAIPTLLGVAIFVFFMLRVLPGDIVETKLRGDGGNVSQEAVDFERHRLGLDRSKFVQFGEWIVGLAKLDLGKSMWTNQPVADEIASRFGLTLEVAILSTAIGVFIAVPLGTAAALFRGSWLDQIIRVFTLAGLAVPSFWLALLMMLALLSWFNWLPPLTYTPFYVDPIANLSQLIWPALATGYRFSAVLARILRSSLLETLSEDYVRTARAKGVFERTVVSQHALRNALLPAITVVGLEFAFLLGGLVVTEQVFNLNGVGRLLVQAVSRNDFVLVQGIVMMTAVFYMLANLGVDIACAILDPRVRYR